MNFRFVGLILFVFGVLGVVVAFIFPSFMKEDYFRYYSQNMLLVFAVLMLVGVSTLLIGITTDFEYQRRLVTVAISRTPHLLFHVFFTALFIADPILLIIFLISPEYFSANSKEHFRDIQILGCIGTSGIMGGFIRQLQTNLRPSELSLENPANSSVSTRSIESSPYVKFWSTLFSLFTALFTAMVLFLLLRAGILKTVEVDTFNVYGVTGVAAVSGYFSDSIIRRFSSLYEQIFDPARSQSSSDKGSH